MLKVQLVWKSVTRYSRIPLVSLHYAASGKSVRSWCDGSSDRSFMVDPLGYFLLPPVPHDWCNKNCGMCYPVCGIMHIKKLAANRKE